MKAIAKDFDVGRKSLLDAATAVDAERPREAERHLEVLRAWCDSMIDRLRVKPDTEDARDKKLRA